MTNLYTDHDSRARQAEQGSMLLCGDTDSQYRPQGRESVLNSLLHEAAHNLGPAHEYAVAGKTDVVRFGGPLASTFEELKAQNSALFLTALLTTKGVLTEEETRRILRDGITWAFGHISRGMYDVDGTPRNYSHLAAIQIGSFIDAKAITWRAQQAAANGKDQGCFEIDYAKLPGAVASLEREVLQIKARGDRAAAEKLKRRYVDAKGGFGDLMATIASRYQRTPKASFVYGIAMPASAPAAVATR